VAYLHGIQTFAWFERGYRWDVPIVIRVNSGFFDPKIFSRCEAHQVGYVCGGKMYENIKQTAADWETTSGNDSNPRKRNPGNVPSSAAGRATESALDGPSYCRLLHDDHDHLFLPGCRPDTIIVTNMGQGQAID
jgi:hypothetical protein